MFSNLNIFFMEMIYAMVVPGILIGVLCIILPNFMPLPLPPYKIPVQISGIILVILFTFFGGRMVEADKNGKQDLIDRAYIAELKSKSEIINTKIVTEYVDRVKIVEKIKEIPINVYITEKADASCVIDPITSNNIARLLNSAAKGRVPATP